MQEGSTMAGNTNRCQSKKQTVPSFGIDHRSHVTSSIADLMDDSETADVTFVVEGVKIMAHRCVFASRSQYFKALLYNGLKESDQREVKLEEVSSSSFRILMKYIYCGFINEEDVRAELTSLLYLADCYCFTSLYQSLVDYVKQNLCPDIALKAFELAEYFQNEDLKNTCLEYIKENAEVVLNHTSFQEASLKVVASILKSDNLLLPEVTIYEVLVSYLRRNTYDNGSIKQIVRDVVRFPLLKRSDLHDVHNDGIFNIEEMLEIIRINQNTKGNLIQYRYLLYKNVNYAVSCYGFDVTRGKPQLQLDVAFLELRGNTYDQRKDDSVIEICLGKRCLANFIKTIAYIEPDKRKTRSTKGKEVNKRPRLGHMSLNDVEGGWDIKYTYHIFVSPDRKEWTRVTGSPAYSHLWQYVYFEPQVVKYVRIVVRELEYECVTATFHLLYFECSYSTDDFKVEDDLYLIPYFNVLSFPKVPSFYPGLIPNEFFCVFNSRNRKELYELHSTHEMTGTNHLFFTLSQDSIVDTMEIWLWDKDERKYDYMVEVGLHRVGLVLLKKECQARSQRVLTFKPTPLRYIRITGLSAANATDNEFKIINLKAYSGKVDSNSIPT